MAACKSCGADASGIACEFCGAVQRPPETLEQQLEALQALTKAAQRLAEDDDSAAMARFWNQAWLPTHPDALVQVVVAALSTADTSNGDGFTVNQRDRAVLRRAEAALLALQMHAPNDTRHAPLRAKVAEAVTALDRADAKAQSGEGKLWMGVAAVVVIAAVVWLVR